MELTKTPYQDMNLRARDDHSLVQMAASGNNAAYSILFDRYRSPRKPETRNLKPYFKCTRKTAPALNSVCPAGNSINPSASSKLA